MAKSYALGKSGTSIPKSTVKKDEIYLDTVHANPLEQTISTNLTVISSSLSKMGDHLKFAANKKAVRDDYAKEFKAWAKKCESQSKSAANKNKALKSQYTQDVQEYTIKVLRNGLNDLNKQISVMKSVLESKGINIPKV